MTTQNWPDPKRPGVPYRYEDTRLILDHILMRRSGKALVRARFHWDAGSGGNWQLRNGHWMSAADAALRFTYVCPALTPTQINEMLAAERERCILACKNEGKAFESPEYSGGKSNAWGELFAVSECIEAIRNLGDAP